MLICVDCEYSQAGADLSDSAELALPNRDLTFHLGSTSLIRYELSDIEVVVHDDDGSQERFSVPLVLAIAGTEPAAATLSLFDLNRGAEFERRLDIRRDDWLAAHDLRPFLRTEAWRHATQMAERLSNEPPWSIGQMVTARHLIAATGFPSVWATVLASATEADQLARVFGFGTDDIFPTPDVAPSLIATRAERTVPRNRSTLAVVRTAIGHHARQGNTALSNPLDARGAAGTATIPGDTSAV